MKKTEYKKIGLLKIISNHKFSKRRKTTFLLIITFSIILFPSPSLISPFIQIENDNQNLEEITLSNVDEESNLSLTTYNNYNNIPSNFWKSIFFLDYIPMIRDLSLHLIFHWITLVIIKIC